MVAGYAIGGGHVLHVICDLTATVTLKHCPRRPHVEPSDLERRNASASQAVRVLRARAK